ncbi:PucR family transcriptional regulator [Nocardia sp. NPDC003979]
MPSDSAQGRPAPLDNALRAHIDRAMVELAPELDMLAAELTDLYRDSIPTYDQVPPESVQRNTRTVLALAMQQLREAGSTRTSDGEFADLIRDLADQQIPLELVAHSLHLGARRLLEAVRQRSDALGIPAEALQDFHEMAWEWATHHAALVHAVQQERAVAHALHFAADRSALVADIVLGRRAWDQLRVQLDEYKLDPNHSYHVLCADREDSMMAREMVTRVRTLGATARRPVVDAIVDNYFIALMARDPGSFSAPHAVGVGPALPLHRATESHGEAMLAITIANAVHQRGRVDLVTLGPLSLLTAAETAARRLHQHHLAPLRQAGVVGAEITSTVRGYLTHDLRIEETARALHLHRNTVRQRINRFSELTGLDLATTSGLVTAWWLLLRLGPERQQ